jgi:hypothetical protein
MGFLNRNFQFFRLSSGVTDYTVDKLLQVWGWFNFNFQFDSLG